MPIRVLIVDDDAAFRSDIARELTRRGYEVAGLAATLAEARAALAALGPDAVLLDVNLPDGDGVTFAAEVRARVLLTSTDAGAAPARLVERSGAAGFLAKTELLEADLSRYLGPAG
jgi:DNA-binding response OmpR family regulator